MQERSVGKGHIKCMMLGKKFGTTQLWYDNIPVMQCVLRNMHDLCATAQTCLGHVHDNNVWFAHQVDGT